MIIEHVEARIPSAFEIDVPCVLFDTRSIQELLWNCEGDCFFVCREKATTFLTHTEFGARDTGRTSVNVLCYTTAELSIRARGTRDASVSQS